MTKLFLGIFLSVFLLIQCKPATTPAPIPNEAKVFPFGVIEEIYAESLHEERTLNIYLPQDFHKDSAYTYPVVYVLDGSAHEDFPHIAGLVQFMNMYDMMPKSIVVGIANVDRYRDFTHPSTDSLDLESLPQSGASAQFISFIKDELQPFIKSKYPTNGHQTIIGQSLGGLLATEVLMTQPDLFDDYIIVSPSLWWNKHSLVDTAADYFKNNQNLKKRIYISLGEEHPVMHEVADKLVAAITNSGNKHLELHYQPILDEDHATILHSAVYKGFKTLHSSSKNTDDK